MVEWLCEKFGYVGGIIILFIIGILLGAVIAWMGWNWLLIWWVSSVFGITLPTITLWQAFWLGVILWFFRGSASSSSK